jgi:hypothetical protein
MPNIETIAGSLEVPTQPTVYNEDFGYRLWEGVVDPANPEGPRGIVMHVPANSQSKVWQLVEPGYHETIELLSGSGDLILFKEEIGRWQSRQLTPQDRTAGGVEIGYTDLFCVLAGSEDTWVLSRPSQTFADSFEIDVTRDPSHELAQYILANFVRITDENRAKVMAAKNLHSLWGGQAN